MICIWSTSVSLTWGVVSLRSIILNMHTWASRVLKPKIQACIHQVSRYLQAATPCSSQLASVVRFDKQLQAPRFGDHAATKADSAKNAQKNLANVDNLIKNLEHTSLTDTCELREGDNQHSSSAANPKKSANLFGVSSGFGSAANPEKNANLFGGSFGFGSAANPEKSTVPFGGSFGFGSAANPEKNANLFAGSFGFGSAANPGKNANLFGIQSTYQSDSRSRLRLVLYNLNRLFGRTNGTADVPFSAFVEKEGGLLTQHYQTITFKSPYQDYSLEELRLADYEVGRRYDETRGVEGGEDQRIHSVDSRSEDDPDSDLGRDASNCSDLEDFLRFDYESANDGSFELRGSVQDNAFEPEACDGDKSFSSEDYWDRRARTSAIRALQSRPLSGERRVDELTLMSITRGLDTRGRRQAQKLADGFRNPDGTCSIPLQLVLRLLSDFLEEDDCIL